jgi:hypothetical protein
MVKLKPRAVCVACDCWKRIHCDDRCMTCYQYRRRHGHDRPIALVIAAGERATRR